MLEKAKNRKIFYFFIILVLGFSLCFSPVSGKLVTISETVTGGTSSTYAAGVSSMSFSVANITPLFDLISIQFIPESGGTIPGNGTDVSVTLKDGGCGVTQTYGSGKITWNSSSILLTVDTWSLAGDEGSHQIYMCSGYFPAGTFYYTTASGSIVTARNIEKAVNLRGTTYITYDDGTPEYDAEIDVSPSSGASPLAVSFTDKSSGFTEGVDLVYLDYGDGNSYSGTYPGYAATRNYVYLDSGTYNYSYRIKSPEDDYYYDNGTVTVTGDSTVNFAVLVRALNGSVIGDATVNIWYDNGSMSDSELTDDFYGTADFYVNPSRYVNGNVTKDGYYTSNFTYYVCPTGYCSNEVWITLYTTNETPGSGDEFGNYLVTFKDAVTGEEVGYSNIEVYSDSGYTTLFYDEYSNALGVWTGLIPMDVIYYYKYPETTSYYSQTWSYNLTSSPSYKTVNLIPKSGATSTTTPTPTTTTTAITPTVTYTYNDSNLSTLNVKERFTNLLVLAGFQNAESADLIFAMIIVLGCTALIGWITLSGTGAGMGAIIGFVFSLGLGLIPLWLLIAAIFFGCLYVSLKLFGGSGE
jgi:hypothetical protein